MKQTRMNENKHEYKTNKHEIVNSLEKRLILQAYLRFVSLSEKFNSLPNSKQTLEILIQDLLIRFSNSSICLEIIYRWHLSKWIRGKNI